MDLAVDKYEVLKMKKNGDGNKKWRRSQKMETVTKNGDGNKKMETGNHLQKNGVFAPSPKNGV